MADNNADGNVHAQQIRLPIRFKDRFNPLYVHGDSALMQIYMFDRQGILYITDMIEDSVSPVTYWNHSIPAIIQTVIALRYFATGLMQLSNADLFGVGQPSVSRIVDLVSTSLARPVVVTNHLNFPRNVDVLRNIQTDLHAIAGCPDIAHAVVTESLSKIDIEQSESMCKINDEESVILHNDLGNCGEWTILRE